MSAADRKFWDEKLTVQSRSSWESRVNRPCWDLDIPITYVACTEDKALPLRVQEMMYDLLKRDHWDYKTFDTGHCPFLSRPDLLVRLLRDLQDDGSWWRRASLLLNQIGGQVLELISLI